MKQKVPPKQFRMQKKKTIGFKFVSKYCQFQILSIKFLYIFLGQYTQEDDTNDNFIPQLILIMTNAIYT